MKESAIRNEGVEGFAGSKFFWSFGPSINFLIIQLLQLLHLLHSSFSSSSSSRKERKK
jgi:hypothetical protein